MKLLQAFGLAGTLAFIALWVAGIVGWVLNIMAIAHSLSGPMTTMLVARIVGIFAFPLGAVLGYC